MSGVKRVGAELVAQAKRGTPEGARFALSVKSRFRDARCFLYGRTLHVRCAALETRLTLPARLNPKASALGILATDEFLDASETGWDVHLTHGVLKYALEPFLEVADMRVLHIALHGLSYAVMLPVSDPVRHQCMALGKSCFCAEFCSHWCYTAFPGRECTCDRPDLIARDAMAQFNHDTGELDIHSPTIHDFWLSVRLPLRMVPRADGVLELKSLTHLEYTCH